MSATKIRVETGGAKVPKASAAFTLTELVIVLAVLSILAATAISIWTHGSSQMLAVECLNHHRQLCNAWRMYAEDHSEKLVRNVQGSDAIGDGVGGSAPAWAKGWLDWGTRSDNTNIAFLTN